MGDTLSRALELAGLLVVVWSVASGMGPSWAAAGWGMAIYCRVSRDG